MKNEHAITSAQQSQVRDGLLAQQNQRRWASYRVAEDSPQNSPQWVGDSPHSAANSPHLSQELLSLAEHDLTDRQRAVLALIEAGTTGVALRELRQRLGHQAAEWEIKNDLALLKQCGLIVPEGRGRGACWRLKPLSFGELE